MISQIRYQVQLLITQNKHREVNRDSQHKRAGVYMIYIDNFDSETIIPFYIGQTKNFQERHKKHLTELMSLNRLRSDCYEYAVLKDLYNGKARACKIFSYMVNHQCTLNDWHMIILDEIDDDNERELKEQHYIDSLYAPYFGFNQLNYVLHRIAYDFGKITKDELVESAKADATMILQFARFGYTYYNWYRVCETIYKLFPSNIAVDEKLTQVLNYQRELLEIKTDLAQKRHFYNWGAEEKAWKLCSRTITDFFISHKLGSKDMPKLAIKALVFGDKKDLDKLNKYFARTKLKSSDLLFEVLWNTHGPALEDIKKEVSSISESYASIEEKANNLLNFVLQQLIPGVHYTSHPLGALSTKPVISPKIDGEDECHINIEYTCSRVDYENDFYPEVCKIDYCIKRNGKLYSRSAYINNSLTGFFENNDVYYYERGFRAGPFNIFLVGNIATHIPVSMEYRNGINESSFKDVSAEDLGKILHEINGLIGDNTTVVYTTSGHKGTALRFLENASFKTMPLSRKIIKQCKK